MLKYVVGFYFFFYINQLHRLDLFCGENLNNLRTINQYFYILNSILLFKTKILEQTEAQV